MTIIDNNGAVTKDNMNIKTESQGDIVCSGTFEIREGTYVVRQQLTVTNTGSNAFEIEDGGKLDFWIPFSIVEVYGGCRGYAGSQISGNGGFLCKADFTLETFNNDWWFGVLVMDGTGTQYIDLQEPGTELENLRINKSSGVCYIKSNHLICGGIKIDSGTLSCENGPSPTATYDILCSGTFDNQAGPAGFDASTGKVAFQYWGSIISPNGTHFNILEMDSESNNFHINGEVSCAAYNWTSGGIEVDEGATFTANDLIDNAIKGVVIFQEGGTINLTNSGTGTYVDLAGELYNYGGTINLYGSLSYWPYGNNAKIKMTSGIIDLKTCGLNIYQTSAYTLTDSISGGAIRTAYGFTGSRADFNPEGGTIEFYGSGNVSYSQSNDGSLYNILINKNPGSLVTLTTNARLTNSLTLQSGQLNSNSYAISIEGDWNNLTGPEAFIEGTGRVKFTGNKPQLCSTEQFNILEIDKLMQYFYNQTDASILCQVYDWTQGGMWIAGNGNFYAADLADNGIYGNYVLWDNSIELHQDASQSINLCGSLNINGGEFSITGGNDISNWGHVCNATLNMTSGILDVKNYGINIADGFPYSFNGTISGGTIRTPGFMIVNSPGFDPAGGMVEIYGTGNPLVTTSGGSAFWDLKTNKPSYLDRVSLSSAKVKNNLIVAEGLCELTFGSSLECGNNLEIQEGGWLFLNSATLNMKNLAAINVSENGKFTSFGYQDAFSTVKGAGSADVYTISANSGSNFEASFTIFDDLPSQGVYIAEGATINPTYSFTNCEFRSGESGVSTLLTINNNQDLNIENALFPDNTWGGLYNVRKSVDAGSVTFINASGSFAGETFENDPYNRIHWGEPKQLNLTLFLEGLYNGPNAMRQANDENGPHFSSGIADEVKLEFRSSLDYYEIEYQLDHVLLGTNGQLTIELPDNLSGSYYITIRHRNSIETTSASPVSFSSNNISYSFDAPSKAYGGNLLLMITGQYVIYGGDVTQDGRVDIADMTPVDNNASNFISGYLATDVNGDGTIDTADMTIIDNNASGFVGSITP